MKARVKSQNVVMIRAAGIIFTCFEWVEVPASAELEIVNNPYLVTDRDIIEIDAPAPQPVDHKAVKLVVTKPGSRKGKRKL